MKVFYTYLLILFITSFVGESLITFTQDVFLYGILPIHWFINLPKSIAAVLFLSSIIAVVAYFKCKPISLVEEKIKNNENLTENDRLVFAYNLPKINKVTIIGLILMYLVGNIASTFIRTQNGVFLPSKYSAQDLKIIFSAVILQTLCYAVTAIIYCSEVFTLVIQKHVRKLGLTLIPENVKEHPFTFLLGAGAVIGQMFGTSNLIMLIVGVGVMKQNISAYTAFFYAILMLLVDAICFYPMAKYMFASLRLRLNISNHNIKSLIAEGDLRKRQIIQTTDGFGLLNSNINSLIIHLQKILTNIKNAVSIVDKNATELSDGVVISINEMKSTNSLLDEVEVSNHETSNLISNASSNITKIASDSVAISENMENQANAIAQNAAAVTQMVANINSISDMVAKAQNLAVKLTNNTDDGAKAVNVSNDLMSKIQEQSANMMEMVSVIQSVASQTNLLAMNAAIEAAHAGGLGTGFSVVADEIRKLAESTSVSTKKVKESIEVITHLIKDSSTSMQETRHVFDLIGESVSAQSELVKIISNAMEEQSIGAAETLKFTNEISGNIAETNGLVQNQTGNIQEIKTAIDEVVSIASKTDNSIKDVSTSIRNFENTLNNIMSSSISTKASVEKVEIETNKFKL